MAAQKDKQPDPVKEAETAQPSDPTRCGGYVLTEYGWVLDTPDRVKRPRRKRSN